MPALERIKPTVSTTWHNPHTPNRTPAYHIYTACTPVCIAFSLGRSAPCASFLASCKRLISRHNHITKQHPISCSCCCSADSSSLRKGPTHIHQNTHRHTKHAYTLKPHTKRHPKKHCGSPVCTAFSLSRSAPCASSLASCIRLISRHNQITQTLCCDSIQPAAPAAAAQTPPACAKAPFTATKTMQTQKTRIPKQTTHGRTPQKGLQPTCLHCILPRPVCPLSQLPRLLYKAHQPTTAVINQLLLLLQRRLLQFVQLRAALAV
jgi:hypothetical protein